MKTDIKTMTTLPLERAKSLILENLSEVTPDLSMRSRVSARDSSIVRTSEISASRE